MPNARKLDIPQALSTLAALLAYDSGVAPRADLPPLKPASEFVKELREQKLHLTQEAFAELLGVNRTMVAKWETGVDQPSWPNVWKILNLAGVFGGRAGHGAGVQPQSMTAAETRLLEEFRRLNDRDQIDVLLHVVELARSQPPAALRKG